MLKLQILVFPSSEIRFCNILRRRAEREKRFVYTTNLLCLRNNTGNSTPLPSVTNTLEYANITGVRRKFKGWMRKMKFRRFFLWVIVFFFFFFWENYSKVVLWRQMEARNEGRTQNGRFMKWLKTETKWSGQMDKKWRKFTTRLSYDWTWNRVGSQNGWAMKCHK